MDRISGRARSRITAALGGLLLGVGSFWLAGGTAQALSVSGPYSSAVLALHPVAYYPLADSGPGTMSDVSGNGHNGVYGGPSGTTSDLTFGQSGPLSGNDSPNLAVTSDEATIGEFVGGSFLPSGNSARTAEAWFKSNGTTSSSAHYTLVSWGTGGTNAPFGLDADQHDVRIDTYNGTVAFDTNANIFDGQWHFLAVTYDGTSERAFLDGTQLESAKPPPNGPLATVSPSTMLVGDWLDHAFNSPIAGEEADVAVFAAALSPAQILGQFRASQITCFVSNGPELTSALADTTCGTIDLAQGTYQGPFTASRPVGLVGAAQSTTVLDGGGPVFTVSPGASVSVSNLTVTGGSNSNQGGGIFNGGTLSLTNVLVSGNRTSSEGGGIFNDDILTISNSVVSRNTAASDGGGIFSGNTLTVTNSTITDNASAGGDGGGIFNGDALSIFQSIVSNNSISPAGHDGGGIFNGDQLFMSGDTVTGNSAPSDGGGIFNGDTLTIVAGLIAHDTAGSDGGGIFNGGTLVMTGSGGIDYNTAASDGGGIFNADTATLTGTTIQGNRASLGGGIDDVGFLYPTAVSLNGNFPPP